MQVSGFLLEVIDLPASCLEIRGIRIYQYPDDGVTLKCGQDAIDLICAAKAQHAAWVAVPMEKLDAAFFSTTQRACGGVLAEIRDLWN
jgi:hypothetical protein